jgi:long-chain acyl-CoA synthetase
MSRVTLVDLLDDFSKLPGDFLVYDDGYRSRVYTYDAIRQAAGRFASRLRAAQIIKGDKIVLWGENRPEWVIALWGCLLEGVIVVPIDFRTPLDFVRRIRDIVDARAVVVGREAALNGDLAGALVWPLAELAGPATPAATPGPGPALTRDDIAEIVFTSGATADPKGVVLTHGNVMANVVPVEREVAKYRWYARPFQPIRFLNLLPLSHMFGQAMATFIPPLVEGVVVFMHGYNPQDIVRQIKSRRISVLVCVPKILEVLREHVLRTSRVAAEPPPPGQHWLMRWWRSRAVHRLFGWKFWCFVVGAAPLDPDLEEFWTRQGFLVVQGYGLTETAPIVTLNHPFRARRGSVGTPIAGVEVKIAADGEILVRGDNVTTGYFRADRETAAAFDGGWFHTGDIGALDEAGRLSIRGRKKEMIVTPDGLNVFPEDVEHALNALAGVRESAVVGIPSGGNERVHAVLKLEAGVTPDNIVKAANARLADHQRIRTFSTWPGEALPRTEGTGKLKRREIRRVVMDGGAGTTPTAGGESLETLVARYAPGRSVSAETTLDELGLSSLERVELMMALEERFQATIDELAFARARTVRDLRTLLEQPAGAPSAAVPPTSEPIDFPAWNRTRLARAIRRVSLPTWILPLQRVFAWISVEGRERLDRVEGPVVFASNHQSHMDTPVVLAALPRPWRYRVATAMAKEFFKAHFFPAEHGRRAWLTSSLNYYLAALFFGAFPLPQREAGTRQTLRYIGTLVSEGQSILIFPEGRRTDHGEINRFQPGVGMIASRLAVPVVPVRLEGLDHVLHQSWRWPVPGRVRVAFGEPLRLEGDDFAALAREVEDAVRRL